MQVAVLLVDDAGKFLEGLEFRLPHRVLQFADGDRIQQVALASDAILIFATDAQFRIGFAGRLERELVFHQRFACQHFHGHAFNARGRAGEVALDQRFLQADGLEDLRALITLQRGNSHLREGLQQALVDRLHVILENFVPCEIGRKSAIAVKIFQRFNGQIRIHCACAIAEQQRKVHHLVRLARFDNQRHLIARLLPNQMIVDGGERQQTGYRRMVFVHATIRQDQ